MTDRLTQAHVGAAGDVDTGAPPQISVAPRLPALVTSTLWKADIVAILEARLEFFLRQPQLLPLFNARGFLATRNRHRLPAAAQILARFHNYGRRGSTGHRCAPAPGSYFPE